MSGLGMRKKIYIVKLLLNVQKYIHIENFIHFNLSLFWNI
jgi:hypothetical protein